MTFLKEFSPHSRVLDLGCGNASQTAFFLNEFQRVVGLDYIHLQGEDIPESSGEFVFVRGDAVSLPFANETFDIITCFEVLEHVGNDYQTISEIHRITKPKGMFILSVPNKWWLFESHGARVKGFNWLPWNRIPFVSWLPQGIHSRIAKARIYTIKKMRTIVEDVGFSVKSYGYITAPLDVLPDGFLRKSLRKTIFSADETKIPFLAVNLYLVCEKI